MAKQLGIIPLQGTIGNITFSKTADGFTARQKGGISAGMIASHPNFQRTRENNAEFRTAAHSARMLTTAFAFLLKAAKDSRMFSRLMQRCMKALHEDTGSERGQRNVIQGDLLLLQGFDFNSRGKLAATLYAPWEAIIDRPFGRLSVTVPAFIPLVYLKPPVGATHYAIVIGGGTVDFHTAQYATSGSSTPILPVNNQQTTQVELVCTMAPGSTAPLFLLLGIQFYQEVNGAMYVLNNGAFNALSIVKVNG